MFVRILICHFFYIPSHDELFSFLKFISSCLTEDYQIQMQQE